MEVFGFLLLLFFATCTCSRQVGPSQSDRSLHARWDELPEGRRPPPRINPYASPNYDGAGYGVPEYMEEVRGVAERNPPYVTRPVVDEGSLRRPLDAPPAEGDSGLVLGRVRGGGQVWVLYLGSDLLGEKPAPSMMQTVGHGFSTFFRGTDDRQPGRAQAATRMQRVEGREEGNLISVLDDMKREIDENFGSWSSDAAVSESVQRFIFSSAMENMYSELDVSHGNLPVQIMDNRSPSRQFPASGSGNQLPSNMGNYRPYGPDTFGGQYRKRSDVLGSISSSSTSSSSGDSATSMEAAYETYFQAFTVAQSNASTILIPIVKNMMSRSNSSLVWNAAWSLFADLTGSSPSIIGPFSFGFNSIQSLEDHIFASLSTNSSMLNQTMVAKNGKNATIELTKDMIMATTGEAITIYNEGWANATAALNATGLMPVMAMLASRMSPTNQSVIPSQFSSKAPSSYDNAFFLDYPH